MDITNFREESSYEDGEDWLEPALNVHTPLSHSIILYLPLFNSVQGKEIFHPRKGHEGLEGSRIWLYSFLNLSSRCGVDGQRNALPPREGESLLFVQEAAWAPGTVWTGAKNLAPIGIRSPDRPASSE